MTDVTFKQCDECNALRAALSAQQERTDVLLQAIDAVMMGKELGELTPAERLLASVAAQVRR